MAKTRGLESINKKLFKGSSSVQAIVRELLDIRRSVTVLEIGCGAGKALMELALEFRHEPVKFYAINKDRGKPLDSGAELPRVARELGVAWEGEGAEWPVPELFFEDATHMHFEDESFDVVYASSVMRFVPQKAEFIEDIARVLRPGGVGLVRVSGKDWDYPHGQTSGGDELTPFAARWVLKNGNDLIPLEAYLKLASDSDFTLELINRPNCVIRITKHRRATLALGLQYVPSLSVPMREIAYGDEDLGVAKGGVRSVYDVPDEQYRLLIERGLIEKETAPSPSSAAQQDHVRLDLRAIANRVWWGSAAACASLFSMASRVPVLVRNVHHLPRIGWAAVYHLPRLSWAAVHGVSRLDWGIVLSAGVLGMLVLPEPKRSRLKSYCVGQRVNIKGRRQGRRFRAAKIKIVPQPTAQDHLEGSVEWVDAEDRSLGLLGITADAVNITTGDEENPLRGLRPGTAVRVRGKFGGGRLLAGGIQMAPASAILVEEIQAPIEAISPTRGILRVAGMSVVANRETKIDRVDAR